MSVLIIDDEVDLCLLIRSYYLRKQFEVFTAHSIAEALPLAKEHQPDRILLSRDVCTRGEEDYKSIRAVAPNAEIVLSNEKH